MCVERGGEQNRTMRSRTVPPQAYFAGSAVFHYLGPAFAVLLFARVAPARGGLASDRERRDRVRGVAPAVAQRCGRPTGKRSAWSSRWASCWP